MEATEFILSVGLTFSIKKGGQETQECISHRLNVNGFQADSEEYMIRAHGGYSLGSYLFN